MKLTIKTTDIELEYQDGYSIIEESAKIRIMVILDKVFTNQSMLNASKPILNPQPIGTAIDEIFNNK